MHLPTLDRCLLLQRCTIICNPCLIHVSRGYGKLRIDIRTSIIASFPILLVLRCIRCCLIQEMELSTIAMAFVPLLSIGLFNYWICSVSIRLKIKLFIGRAQKKDMSALCQIMRDIITWDLRSYWSQRSKFLLLPQVWSRQSSPDSRLTIWSYLYWFSYSYEYHPINCEWQVSAFVRHQASTLSSNLLEPASSVLALIALMDV